MSMTDLYAFPFMDSSKNGVGSVMCLYQRANNSYACRNSKLLNGILKTELGFVVSDWDAQHAGVSSANAGLDIVMPDNGFWGQNLTQAVNNGSVSEDRITDMATRILSSWYYLDQDTDYPPPSVYSNTNTHPSTSKSTTLITGRGVGGLHAAVCGESVPGASGAGFKCERDATVGFLFRGSAAGVCE